MNIIPLNFALRAKVRSLIQISRQCRMRPKSKSQREEKRRNWAAKRRQKHLERVARRSQSTEESTTPMIHPGPLSLFFFSPPCHVSIRPRFHQYVQLACTSAETPRDEDTAGAVALATFSVASCQNLTAIHHTGATFSPIQIHPRSTYSSTHQHVNSHVQLQKRRGMKMPPLSPPRSPPFL